LAIGVEKGNHLSIGGEEHPMRIASLADVKARLSAYVEQCRKEGPVVITRNGKAVAVLLAPKDDDDLESILLAHSPRFQAMLEKSRKSIRDGNGYTEEDFWKETQKPEE
jgi:prevent-host-death family protein